MCIVVVIILKSQHKHYFEFKQTSVQKFTENSLPIIWKDFLIPFFDMKKNLGKWNFYKSYEEFEIFVVILWILGNSIKPRTWGQASIQRILFRLLMEEIFSSNVELPFFNVEASSINWMWISRHILIINIRN